MKSANHSEPLQQCFKDPGSWKFPKLFDNRFKFSVNLLRYVASLHRASMVALQSPISFACGFLPDVSIGLKSVQQAFHIYLLFERAFRLQMHTHTTECAQSKKEKNYTCTNTMGGWRKKTHRAQCYSMMHTAKIGMRSHSLVSQTLFFIHSGQYFRAMRCATNSNNTNNQSLLSFLFFFSSTFYHLHTISSYNSTTTQRTSDR